MNYSYWGMFPWNYYWAYPQYSYHLPPYPQLMRLPQPPWIQRPQIPPQMQQPQVPQYPEAQAAPMEEKEPGFRKSAPGYRDRKTEPVKPPVEFTASGLTDEDIALLVSLYGNDIENVYDLSAGQRWMLDQSDRADNAFFLQVMLNAVIHIDPPEFRKHVDSVCEKRESLKSAFVVEGLSKPVRVVLKNRRVEILFRDLSEVPPKRQEEMLEEIKEADRRRGFELAKDALLRIACYKRDDRDSYALLISQPHIDSDGTSLMLLMKDLILPFMIKGAEHLFGGMQQNISDRKYGQWLKDRKLDEELDFWKDTLSGLPAHVPLPGWDPSGIAFTNRSYFLSLGEELTKKLGGMQSSCHATLTNICQAAWAALIMRIRENSDFTYGLVTAGREAEVAESFLLTGGFINVIPIRIKKDDGTTFRDLVQNVSQNQIKAIQNSHCSVKEIQNALGRKDLIFDHLLNFQNFAGAVPKGPAQGPVKLDVQTYDNLSEDLCIYFTNQEDAIVCNFTYNRSAFSKAAIRLLSEGYRQILTQIAESGPDIAVSELKSLSVKDFESLKEQKGAEFRHNVSLMRKLHAFDGLEDRLLLQFLKECHVLHYEKNDMILFPDKTPDGVLFLLSGLAEYTGVNMKGWTMPLRLIRQGGLISAKALWNGDDGNAGKYERSARVESGNASVLLVPADKYERLIAEYPLLAFNLMKEIDQVKTVMESIWLTV